MTDSVNSVSSTSSSSSTSSTSSSSATKLSAATKTQLQALGVDTSSITTEAQGQIALLQAQAQQAQKAQQAQSAQGNTSEDSIKSEAKTLASQLGVSVSDSDKTDDILSNISSKISELRQSAGEDESKLAEVEQYESQLETLSSQYTSSQASKAQLSGSMSGLANYNKASLNL